jgi:AcrR family transcriptional regulator
MVTAMPSRSSNARAGRPAPRVNGASNARAGRSTPGVDGAGADGVGPLAPAGGGRDALGREGVAGLQRARIVTAMTALVSERGVAGVTVAHVVARSGVSRRTFYELFDDREDCFLAAFDTAIARAAEGVSTAYRGAGGWRERTRAALRAALAFLDAEREMGTLIVVGALGGGPRALQRRAEVLRSLVDAVHEGHLHAKGSKPVERLVAEGVLGAVLAVIHARLLEANPGPLVGLSNPLMGIIVLPYLGPAAAAREAQRPAPRAPRLAKPRGDPLRDLDMRLTYRTIRVLLAIATEPAASNRQVASAAGIGDQGQISKLLSRLQALGLIENNGGDHAKGEPNAWTLTTRGRDITHTIQTQTKS